MIIKQRLFIFLLVASITSWTIGIPPVNMFRPWDINLRPWIRYNKKCQAAVYDETGLEVTTFGPGHPHENALQVWNETQDALAMLQGFPAGSPETLFFENVLLSPVDNGIRGHLRFLGDLHLNASAGFSFYYNAPHHVQISAHLPLYAMSLNKIIFQDLTQDNSPSDILVKQNLTNNLAQTVHQFDPTLNLNNWSRVGPGDFAIMAEWRRSFRQRKPHLKNVDLLGRGILTFPSGLKRNVNEIFSVPFGYEGVGLLFGGGITLNWWDTIRGGIDFEFLYIFTNKQTVRIKVNENQTDFLFLAKTKAYREFGITERYQLFLETAPLCYGISGGVAYQFWKHARDKLVLLNQDFSNQLANTAQNLQEWTMHQLIFKLWYNSAPDGCGKNFDPQVLLFYKLPLTGKRSVMFHTIGALVAFSF
jgi:hypothetical protein